MKDLLITDVRLVDDSGDDSYLIIFTTTTPVVLRIDRYSQCSEDFKVSISGYPKIGDRIDSISFVESVEDGYDPTYSLEITIGGCVVLITNEHNGCYRHHVSICSEFLTKSWSV